MTNVPINFIRVPDLCQAHQAAAVQAAGLTPADPWQAELVVVSIAMFQAASRDGRMWKRTGPSPSPDVTSMVLAEIGCLGCFLPSPWSRCLGYVRDHGWQALAKATQTGSGFDPGAP